MMEDGAGVLETEESVNDMVVRVSGDTMQSWSESKKRDFVNLFKQRVEVSKWLSLATAMLVFEAAEKRSFVSELHDRAILRKTKEPRWIIGDHSMNWSIGYMVGGRSCDELAEIARKRARQIIRTLPPLMQAVEVIDKNIANKISEIKIMQEQLKALHEEVVSVTETIYVRDLPRDMTLSQLQSLVEERTSKRERLISKMNSISKRGREYEAEIAKVLYSGLPGLSDAVVDVIVDKIRQYQAFDVMVRRVEETVMFGDSSAATNILKSFEQDEITLDSTIKDKFAKAMQVLKDAAKAGTKLGASAQTKKTKQIGG